MRRHEVSESLAAYYSEKMGGKVWAFFDETKRAYCIRGERLPAHPDLQRQCPNGWSLLDFITPTEARRKIANEL